VTQQFTDDVKAKAIEFRLLEDTVRDERTHEPAQGGPVHPSLGSDLAARHRPGRQDVREAEFSGSVKRARGAHDVGQLPQHDGRGDLKLFVHSRRLQFMRQPRTFSTVSANSGLMQCKKRGHSITSSARNKSDVGMDIPSA
jgi:hypothetical protein